MDLVGEGYDLVDKRALNSVPFPLPKVPLRESQLVVFEEVEDSCFINALVGWGKTFTALYLARKLGQKTLVVTHTTALRDQWVEEATALFGIRPGTIGSGIFDIEDHYLVIANIQTVTKMIPQISSEFGLVILDEAHHVPANTFASVIDGMYARYRIALSGTMERTDGKHVIFKDYFGPKIIRPPQSHTIDPKISIVHTGIKLNANLAWAAKINSLMYDPEYQRLVAGIAASQISMGHSVLIVADRVEFLTNVKDILGASCVLITGEVEFEERKALIAQIEKREKMCIAGSRQIFSEGISVNILSCVIMATPTSNPSSIEQIIGRIMRKHPDKLSPRVIDLNFSSTMEKRQDKARKAFYIGKGWEIEDV